ncbi:hypothetical protein B0H16DRAFT_1686339 [Mycena metata]|uniref:Uncharacterized protein n=1 Tax=Mycena metata TaxID=1033252 RepID=A0AAD7NNF1_9AGAR|nr:hypothetical protein B0H16DRAFT_1686339 [Mycena metata]
MHAHVCTWMATGLLSSKAWYSLAAASTILRLCPELPVPLRPRGRNTKGLPAMSPHLPDEIVSEILSPALKVSEEKFSDNKSGVGNRTQNVFELAELAPDPPAPPTRQNVSWRQPEHNFLPGARNSSGASSPPVLHVFARTLPMSEFELPRIRHSHITHTFPAPDPLRGDEICSREKTKPGKMCTTGEILQLRGPKNDLKFQTGNIVEDLELGGRQVLGDVGGESCSTLEMCLIWLGNVVDMAWSRRAIDRGCWAALVDAEGMGA